MNLSLEWTKHVRDPEKKKDFEAAIRNSTLVLGRVRDIVRERIASINSAETKAEDYNTSGWAFRQAFRNGRKAELRDLEALLQFLGD